MRAIKFKNNDYLDSTGIVHNKVKLNDFFTTVVNEILLDEKIDNEKTNISFKTSSNVCTIQGVIYTTASINKWTTFITISNLMSGYGNLINEESGLVIPVILSSDGTLQCSMDVQANKYYYINITFLI